MRAPDHITTGNPVGKQRGRLIFLSAAIFLIAFISIFLGPAFLFQWRSSEAAPSGPDDGLPHLASTFSATSTVTEVNFQQGVFPTAGYSGCLDTSIVAWQEWPHDDLWLRAGQLSYYRPLIYFDLTPGGIPTGAYVESATLYVYAYTRNMVRELEVEPYYVTRTWSAPDATWTYATLTDTWGIAGCDDPTTDRAPHPSSTTTYNTVGTWHSFDVRSIVQQWVDDPTSNHGMVLVARTPSVIYYYWSSQCNVAEYRPRLRIVYGAAPPTTPTPTPTPTKTNTPGPSPTPTRTPTVTPTLPGPPVILDDGDPGYSRSGAWFDAVGNGGYANDYDYETDVLTTNTASWQPPASDPVPADGMYEIFAHWSVHSARPVNATYTIHYQGGTATVQVDQTKDAGGSTVPDFTASGWKSLGIYPLAAGTVNYVEISSVSPGDTCADAIRIVPTGLPGQPYSIEVVADPSSIVANGTATSTIRATVRDRFGNPVANGTMVGITCTAGASVPTAYAEAELAPVVQSGTWVTVANASASGGNFLRSSTAGSELSWSFTGSAVSLVYATSPTGGIADVIVDGSFATQIDMSSAATKWQVERVIRNNLTFGPHTIVVRVISGIVRVDAFRSGVITSGGLATVNLTAGTTPAVVTVRGTALGIDYVGLAPAWPMDETTVTTAGPFEVWVDDDYTPGGYNDGHQWGYDAFNKIYDGVTKTISTGTVHVLSGTYNENVVVTKTLSILGVGADTVILDGVSDTGTGFYIDQVSNVTISGLTIKNFSRGIDIHGTGATNVYTITITNNIFDSNGVSAGSEAIYGTYVFNSILCNNIIRNGQDGIDLWLANNVVICYNEIYNNKGVGVWIERGDNNSIDNNHIYNNRHIGVRITSPANNNGIFNNHIHDQYWDGIHLGSAVAGTQIVSNTITNTNKMQMDGNGNVPSVDENDGAITLVSTTNTNILDNVIQGVSNAEGTNGDTAGIHLRNPANTNCIIERNSITYNANHGVYIRAAAGRPVLHRNTICGNGKFGIINNMALPAVDAEGNWWGRNSPTQGLTPPRDIYYDGITDSVDEDPQIRITLTRYPTAIAADGVSTSTITATVRSTSGHDIIDGSLVTFATNRGTFVGGPTVPTLNGVATILLRAGTVAGTSYVTGTLPCNGTASTTVNFTAGPPANLSVVAIPSAIPRGGPPAGQAVISATLKDIYGNPVPGEVVTFTVDTTYAYLVGAPPVVDTTDALGEATATLRSLDLVGTAQVTATAASLIANTTVDITGGPPVTITVTADPTHLPANGVAQSLITAVISDAWGGPVPDGTMVGFTTTAGSMIHAYTEAESGEVFKTTGDWTTAADASASGGQFVYTDNPGAFVSWSFRGQAVSLRYVKSPLGGVAEVSVDGVVRKTIDMSAAGVQWLEEIIASDLSPGAHQIRVLCLSGRVYADAFRSGTTTTDGVATTYLTAGVTPLVTAIVWGTTGIETGIITDDASVFFEQSSVVWVDDDWVGLPNGTDVGSGRIIGSNAAATIQDGLSLVQTGGSVFVLGGTYYESPLITKTLNLVGFEPGHNAVVDGYNTLTYGIRVDPGVDNVLISGFTIQNFRREAVRAINTAGNPGEGLRVLDNIIQSNDRQYGDLTPNWTSAISVTYVMGGQFVSNVISGNQGGLYLRESNGNLIQSNQIYNNNRYAIELEVCDNNIVDSNEIHDNESYGIRVYGAGISNTISSNIIHDVYWDGIRVESGDTTRVISNTLYNTNRRINNGEGLSSGPNLGAIVLRDSTDSLVQDNWIYNTQDAEATIYSGGIVLDGNNSGITILYNLLHDNTHSGIRILNPGWTGTVPEIHGNSIYGNADYGIANLQPGTPVDAECNWWGRNTPTVGAVPPRDIYNGVGANVDYNPRLQIVLTANPTSIPVGGLSSSEIRAIVQCTSGGTLYHIRNGTPITFTTNLGAITGPVTTTMTDGIATTVLHSGLTAGTATVTGCIPPLPTGCNTVDVEFVPGPPFSISMVAVPNTIPTGLATSIVTATVRDQLGNLIDGATIYFSVNPPTLGTVNPVSSVTAAGVATTTFRSATTPGVATVSANWGYVTGSVPITITAGAPYTITLVAYPTSIPADGVSTAALTATVVDLFGNPVPDCTLVGFTTTLGYLPFTYTEESALSPAAWVGTWTTASDPAFSGGSIRYTSDNTAAVTWQFTGTAVSLIHSTASNGGEARAYVDGLGPYVMNMYSASTQNRVESQIPICVPYGVHNVLIEAQLDPGEFIWVDAFRSGLGTINGMAVAALRSTTTPGTATVYATAAGNPALQTSTTVEFAQPCTVWVDDNWVGTPIGTDLGGGKVYGYSAFATIQAGVDAVCDGGTVYVLDGLYSEQVSITTKSLNLLGAGSATTTIQGPAGITATAQIGTRGIYVYRRDNVTISGFTIRRFDYGIYLHGTAINNVVGAIIQDCVLEDNDAHGSGVPNNASAIFGQYVTSSLLRNLTIRRGQAGIQLENSSWNDISSNLIYNNNQYGIMLYNGQGNTFNNNDIYDMREGGIYNVGSTDSNTIMNNRIHDTSWDGIHIGTLATNARVVGNTVYNTNLSYLNGEGVAADDAAPVPRRRANRGGIVLWSTMTTTVEYNTVYGVSNAGLQLPNSAGILLAGPNPGSMVRYNVSRNNTNHGIWLSTDAVPGTNRPEFHGNTICGNGKFGFINTGANTADATGNWWGRNTPTTGLTPPRDIYSSSVLWDPPIRITLTRSPTSMTADGVSTAVVTATGTSGTYNILNGTLFTFSTDIYSTLITPSIVPSANGVATATIRAGTVVPPAPNRTYITVTTEPCSYTDSTHVTLRPGPPYTITLQASPVSIPILDGPSYITATVTDRYGNLVADGLWTLNISTDLGNFDAPLGPTNVTRAVVGGQAYVQLYSADICGVAHVQANSNEVPGVSGSVNVGIIGGPPASVGVVASPPVLPADALSTSTIYATVVATGTGGCPVEDGTFVGFDNLGGLGSIPYDFVEAEFAPVLQSGNWITGTNANASGGMFLQTDEPGASLTWQFYGKAIAVKYRRGTAGGLANVYVDGLFIKQIDMSLGWTEWQTEQVIANNLTEGVAHTIQVSCLSGRVWVDAFHSGSTTQAGVATCILTAHDDLGETTIRATVGPLTTPVTYTAFSDVVIQFRRSRLSITKSVVPTVAHPSEIVTFTLYYTNTNTGIGTDATGAATNATIVDTLPPGLVYVSSTSSPDIGSPTGSNPYSWSAGTLAPGGNGWLRIQALVTTTVGWGQSTILTNTATITTTTRDNDLANNTTAITLEVKPGPPHQLLLTADPPSIPVGGGTSNIQATVTDQWGNPVLNGTPVTFTTDLGGFPVVQSITGATTNGVVNQTLTSGPIAGTAHVAAEVNGITDTVNVQFTPLSPFTITVAAYPSTIAVGGEMAYIVATVVDQYGNRVADGWSVSFEASMGSLSPNITTTVGGDALTQLTSGDVAGTAYITATCNGRIGTTTVQFVPAEERQVTLQADPPIVRVGLGQADGSRLIATVRDLFGNLVGGRVVTFTTSLGTFPNGMNTWVGMTSNASGSPDFGKAIVRLQSITVGTAIVNAETEYGSASTQVRFIPGPTEHINLTIHPRIIPICGGTGIITATVQDMFGNAVQDGTLVGFSIFSIGTVDPGSVPTVNGVVTAVVRSESQTGWATVQAEVREGGAYEIQHADVYFIVGKPDHIVIFREPWEIQVGGQVSRITALVQDCGNNSVADGTVVTFTTSLGTFGSGTTVTDTTRAGLSSVYLTSGNRPGTATISVQADSQTNYATVDFIPGPPYTITLSASPRSIPADGVATSTIVAVLQDYYGNPVADDTVVRFNASLGTFNGINRAEEYSRNGQASAVLKSGTTPGRAYVNCNSGAAYAQTYVDFYYAPTPTPTPEWAYYLRMPIIIKKFAR
ncbi:MAG: right-handed parallel beta-helix repeat-containing protein [Chloroflexi bacterium]|nr:right-handed parallel beta-helix repeat-containing protein [Chloroflexota bacterium]